MYLQYYGLDDYPFSVTPDPAFLFLGTPHREALGHLLYGAGEHGGFVQLSGEVGTGKTTLIRALLDNPAPDLDVALCWHPQLEVREFVANICDELGVAYDAEADNTLKALVDRLNNHLLESHAAGRRTLLIIDEAQNLSRDVLEQLRLLTNLETTKHKLLRIILVGQPELDIFLARHDLRQLSQRVSARFTLTSLDCHETAEYIHHRLACAGGSGRLFTPSACRLLYWYTRGIPRLINLVCERALMGAYANGRPAIGALTVHKAARETLPESPEERRVKRLKRPAMAAAAVVLVILLVGALPSAQIQYAFSWVTTDDSGIVARAEAATGPQPGHVAQVSPAAKGTNTKTGTRAPEISADPLMLNPYQTEQTPAEGAPSIVLASNAATDSLAQQSGAGQRAESGASGDAESTDTGSSGTGQAGQPQQSGQPGEDGAVLPPDPSTLLPDGDARLSQLLRQWGVLGAQTQTSCATFHVGKLYCLSEQGSLTMLDRFNRPALLVLEYNDQQQRVLLTALGKKKATLVGANATRRIKREQLARLWTGRFFMIWRANTGVIFIHDNMIGDAVVWLRKRLARAAADNKSPDQKRTRMGPWSPIFDDDLEARVRHFQLMHGLKPDGIAGPRTQIMLNGIAPAPGTPTLKAGKPEKD